jgi:hypothetical protein
MELLKEVRQRRAEILALAERQARATSGSSGRLFEEARVRTATLTS